jgi:glucosamine-6-phosphate deaminase
MWVEVVADYEAMSLKAAEKVADLVRKKPEAVVGFATGSTPLGLYRHLIRLHREEGLDFSGITTFNLDEYIGLGPDHPQSYHRFMWEALFNALNVNPESVHIPSGLALDIDRYCAEYEESLAKKGGMDLQILGIGTNGHLAFNEPGGSLNSRTRSTLLTSNTLSKNARFFESIDRVPRSAITMGIGSIMEARKLLMLASGEEKAEAIQASLEGPLTAMMPASILQCHPSVHVVLDEGAAANLAFHHHEGIAEPKE